MNSEPRTQNSELRTRNPEIRSFTLIELMVVMAIIALMAGALLPALRFARDATKKHVARTDMSNLGTALKAFHLEYGYWPQTTSWTEMGTMLNANNHPYTGMPAAAGWASNNNPRAIQFMEFKTTNQIDVAGALLDPWGSPYIVLSDHGGPALGKAGWSDTLPEDGKVTMPGGGTEIQAQVAIYSVGIDKTDNNGNNTTEDDLPSWME